MLTVHQLSVPTSVADHYGRARLTLFGGATRFAPESVLNYDVHSSQFSGVISEATFPGDVGRHSSPWLANQVQTTDDDHVLRWAVAAMTGSRYDVKHFIVEVEYYVLGYPG